MPSNQSPRQRQKWLTGLEVDVLRAAARLHKRLGTFWKRHGHTDLASDEAESARRALKRAREIT